MRRFISSTLIVAAWLAQPAAHAQERVKETIITDQASAAWAFEGAAKVKEIAAKGIPGDRALQVDMPRRGSIPGRSRQG